MRATALASLLLAGLAACAASGGSARSGGSGQSLRVTLRDYGSGQHFELVSESHTDRVAYYSEVRTDAATKVQGDEVMGALISELSRLGLGDHSQGGRAPTRRNPILSWSLELQRGSSVSHWAVGKGSDPEEWQRFNECVETFLQLYNVTSSYQTVENPSGKDYFRESSSGRT